MKRSLHHTAVGLGAAATLITALITCGTAAFAQPTIAPGATGGPGASAPPMAPPMAPPAPATPPTPRPRGHYVALGDSVPFGLSPLLALGDPARYVGYPELAAKQLHLSLSNLACPGQTSGGFLSTTGTDNGCFPFRSAAHLHVDYPGAQLDAALADLAAHPDTRLVTVMLGANDLFLCADTTADRCTSPSEAGAMLQTYGANLTAALTAIRQVYHGPLIGVTYYSTDYADPGKTVPLQALNAVTTSVLSHFDAGVADGYAAFQQRAEAYGGSSCAAGLLIALPTGGCNLHPSRAGADVLAHTVADAARRAEHAQS